MINLLHGSDYRANPFWNDGHVDNRSTQYHDMHVMLFCGYVNPASWGTRTRTQSSRLNRVDFRFGSSVSEGSGVVDILRSYPQRYVKISLPEMRYPRKFVSFVLCLMRKTVLKEWPP